MIKWGLVFVLVGCASTTVTQLTNAPYPIYGKCSIEILTDYPREPFTKLCLITRRTGTGLFAGKDLNAMLPDLTEEACKCGANAIVITHYSPGSFQLDGTAPGQAMVYAIEVK